PAAGGTSQPAGEHHVPQADRQQPSPAMAPREKACGTQRRPIKDRTECITVASGNGPAARAQESETGDLPGDGSLLASVGRTAGQADEYPAQARRLRNTHRARPGATLAW